MNFNFELKFTANDDDKAFDFKSLGDQSFNIKFSFTEQLNINDTENEYIKFPDQTIIGTISKSGFTASSGETTTSNVITYNGKLEWGSYFGGKNPSELDDSTVSSDSTKVDSYIQGLNHIKTSLVGKSFVITVNIDKAV